ncbi:hypothetical protein ACFY0F_00005 [Streptomyces sp. NPDC001544]|uniref:hypothetical protein n=1 Tax=Streptomyces sp. NPDC001544 TaxID=3364584 RepID=UPI0036C76908
MPDDTTPAGRDDRPEESRRVRLSRTFDEDAELYDRARPGYPPELYDDLAQLADAGLGEPGVGLAAGGGLLKGRGIGAVTQFGGCGLGPHGQALAGADGGIGSGTIANAG